ncbi:hypothetical protein [Actinomadura macrotermitis]|uniref:Uncharacterized protein n=1 Tax=Actinomadura macrotermitis TaxID=2585200 RepID=A0A7K0BRR3_9ACTN|nr:hypothetical protein [Actinomadura macrotermitis]MQY03841.1 hypothetical protein [Actinomadura macrotermitis]
MNIKRWRSDRGEGSIGYITALLLVAVVVAALITTGVGGQISGHVGDAVCLVFNAGDAAKCETAEDRALRPGCLTAIASDSYGGSVEVLFFRAGRDYTFVRINSIGPDGKKTVKVLAVKGVTGGVGTGIGIGVNGGNLFNLGADALAEAKVRIGAGDGWLFTGPDADKQADDFEKKIREQYTIDAVKENGGLLGTIGGGIYDAVAGPDIPKSDTMRFEIEGDVMAGLYGSASIGPKDPTGKHRKPDRHTSPPSNKPPSAKDKLQAKLPDSRGSDFVLPNSYAWVGIDGNEKAIGEYNKKTGETTVTLMLKGEVNYGANLLVAGPQGRASSTGSVAITMDKNKKITGLTLTQTRIVNGRATMITTELPITNDADRAAVADFLFHPLGAVPGSMGALALTWDDMAPTKDPGPDATPLQRLLYEKARSSKTDYDYDQQDNLYGASVKLGVRLGLNGLYSESSRKVTNGEYLGSARPDGTRIYKPLPNCKL